MAIEEITILNRPFFPIVRDFHRREFLNLIYILFVRIVYFILVSYVYKLHFLLNFKDISSNNDVIHKYFIKEFY